jgi:hypothetical protein
MLGSPAFRHFKQKRRRKGIHTPCSSRLVTGREETLHVHTAGGVDGGTSTLGYNQHKCTLHVHTAGGVDGYTLHVYTWIQPTQMHPTRPHCWWCRWIHTARLHLDTTNTDAPYTSTLLVVWMDTHCTSCAADFSFAQLAKGKKSRP